jgi:hypothetical protein
MPTFYFESPEGRKYCVHQWPRTTVPSPPVMTISRITNVSLSL